MKYKVKWMYASAYETARVSEVEATSVYEAKRRVEVGHVEPESSTRNAIEILRVWEV